MEDTQNKFRNTVLNICLQMLIFFCSGKTDDMPERGWVQAMEQSVVAQFPASAIRDAQDSYPMAVVHKP